MKMTCFFRLSLLVSVALLLSSPRSLAQVGAPPITLPYVQILAPTNGESFSATTNIVITANAIDNGAFVHEMEFFAGAELLADYIIDPAGSAGGSVTVSYTWPNVPLGTYLLTVIAKDTAGRSGTSAPVNISVVKPVSPVPVVTIFATDPIASVCSNSLFYPVPVSAASYIAGANTATFLVRRSNAAIGPAPSFETNGDLTVYYSTGGTASNGVDYVELPGTVVIPQGRTFALITIHPLKNPKPSPALFKTVVISLRPPVMPLSPIAGPPPYIVGWPSKAGAIILETCNTPLPVTGTLPGGVFHLCQPSVNGLNYSIQVSTNLVDWTPVLTSTVLKSAIDFIDPELPDTPLRFYRTVPATGPALY